MAYTPATLTALLKGLSLSDQSPDHTEILKHANNVLQTETDPIALRTKVVALLHLDRYDEALKTLEETPLAEADFERAYALYKLGKLELAAKVAREAAEREKVEKRKRGLAHVEAQAAYRLGEFGSALSIYKSLIETGKVIAVNEDFDLQVNRSATEAQLLWSGAAVEKRKTSSDELSAFETAYNTACIHAARKEYQQALILLRKAQELCNALDLTEEEKKEELAPVIAQRIYILLELGKIEEASQLSDELNIEILADASVKYIASNNQISLKSITNPNPHLSERLFEAKVLKPISAATAKPFPFQEKLLHRNRLSLDLQIGKYHAVENQAKQLSSSGDVSGSLYTVAAKIGNKPAKEALKELKKMIATDEGKGDIGLALMTTQAYLEVGNVTEAVGTVESLIKNVDAKHIYSPALVGLLVALHKRQGRTKPSKELHEASMYWKDRVHPNEPLLLASSLNLLTSSDPAALSTAGTLLSSIRTHLPPPVLSAGLVAAYSTTNPSLAQPHLSTLPSVTDLIKGIDINSLESSGLYVPSKKRPLDADESTTTNPSAKKKQKQRAAMGTKKKRARKSRLPKEFDPSKKIDPERWLPLRDRSYYKPKGGKKDRKKMMAQGVTQGGKVLEENLESASGPARVGTPPVVGKTPPAQQGGAAKKKKKKGGKW